MHPVEFTWYKGLVLLISAMAVGFGILNIVYFNEIRLNNNCEAVSSTEANVALWLNLILVIFATILLLWSLYRLIFSGDPEKETINETYNTFHHPAPSVESPVYTNSPSSNIYNIPSVPGTPNI